MEEKKFTQEELDQIKKVQTSYQSLGISLVQLQVLRASIERELEKIQESENQVKVEIQKTSELEQEISKTLSEKYGVGTLDLQSGVFKPQN
jgi:DNA-binding transcriptional regulator LsrR (DeoR family)